MCAALRSDFVEKSMELMFPTPRLLEAPHSMLFIKVVSESEFNSSWIYFILVFPLVGSFKP